MILGFTTGRTDLIPIKEKIATFKQLGCNALEIGVRPVTLKDVKTLTKSDINSFAYVSLHAPAHDFVYQNDKLTRNYLGEINKLYKKFHLSFVVIHPDRVKDWKIFKEYNFPIAIENSDHRKDIGRTVESLKKLFGRIDVPMVLDVNHCFANDRSLKLVGDLYEAFQDRIKHIHLSGFETLHDLLFKTRQVEIIEAIPDKKLPIIIESPQRSLEDIRLEYEYIKSHLVEYEKNHQISARD